MKKLSFILLLFVLSNCGKSQRQINTPDQVLLKSTLYYSENYDEIRVTSYYIDGIEYKIFHDYNVGLYVVNHTKEVLEVNKLKKP